MEQSANPSPQATPSEARGPSPELAAAASKFREVLGDRKIVIGPPSLDKLREAAQSVVSVLPPRPPNPMIPRTNKDFFQVSYSSLAALDAALAARPHPEEQKGADEAYTAPTDAERIAYEKWVSENGSAYFDRELSSRTHDFGYGAFMAAVRWLRKGHPEEQGAAPTDADLKALGYVPGGYSIRCSDCREEKGADKRAIRCHPCAVERWRMEQNSISGRPEEQGEAPDHTDDCRVHLPMDGACTCGYEARLRSRTPSQGGAATSPAPAPYDWPEGNAGESLQAVAKALRELGRPMDPEIRQIAGGLHAGEGLEPSAPKTELRGPAAQGPAWVLTDKNEAFIHPTKDSAELHRVRMYFPEAWKVIQEKGAAPVRYVEAGGLEDAKVIWDGTGGPVREIAVQRDRIFGRWDAGVPWALLGILPLEARSAPEPKATGPIPSPVTPEIPIKGDKGPGGAG